MAYYTEFRDNLFDFSILQGVLTDSHFKERNRMARFVTFLTRTQTEIDTDPAVKQRLGGYDLARGIAVDEGTALIVTWNATDNAWVGKVKTIPRAAVALPGYVFFARAVVGAGVTFTPGLFGTIRTLGTTEAVAITRLGNGERFNLDTWAPLEQPARRDAVYTVEIINGRALAESEVGALTRPGDLYYDDSSQDHRLLNKHTDNGEHIP